MWWKSPCAGVPPPPPEDEEMSADKLEPCRIEGHWCVVHNAKALLTEIEHCQNRPSDPERELLEAVVKAAEKMRVRPAGSDEEGISMDYVYGYHEMTRALAALKEARKR